ADVQLVARFHADDAEVLDRRLGAVARAARHGKLDLVRMPRAPRRALELYAQARRILRAEAAPLLADASLHGAQRLAIGVARDEARVREVAPDVRQVLFLHAEQVEPLSARDLDGRHGVFLGNVGDRAQLLRRRDAAPDARHDGVRSVALDVAVRTLVDEARVLVVAILAGPRAEHVEVQRGPALVAAVRRLPLEEVHGVRYRLELLAHDRRAHLLVRVDRARAHR